MNLPRISDFFRWRAFHCWPSPYCTCFYDQSTVVTAKDTHHYPLDDYNGPSRIGLLLLRDLKECRLTTHYTTVALSRITIALQPIPEHIIVVVLDFTDRPSKFEYQPQPTTGRLHRLLA